MEHMNFNPPFNKAHQTHNTLIITHLMFESQRSLPLDWLLRLVCFWVLRSKIQKTQL